MRRTAVRAAAFLLSTALVLALLGACATSIPVTVTKPAEINMAGNRVVAVLDFHYPDDRTFSAKDLFSWAISRLTGLDVPREETPEQRVAEYGTTQVVMTLLDTGYFQLVSPNQVARAMEGKISAGTTPTEVGKAVNAQAIISGELYMLESRDEDWSTERVVTDQDGNERTIEVPMVKRIARVGMSYHVTSVQSGKVIASRSFEGRRSEDAERANRRNLAEPEEMYRRVIDDFMPDLARQLAPYQVREHRTLMRDKSKDPAMERADELVKARLYEEALQGYLSVWERSRNPAAGFNAAILYEVTGRIEEAIAQMKQVVQATGERRAVREYDRLLQVRREQERLKEQQG